MAWVRTATSLIGFGFTIYKFFQFMHEEGKFASPHRLLSSRKFALLMILIGLAALVLATVQHRQDTKRLRVQYPETPYSLATVIATLIAGLGILGLFAVLFRQ